MFESAIRELGEYICSKHKIFTDNWNFYTLKDLSQYDALDTTKVNEFYIRYDSNSARNKTFSPIEGSNDELATLELIFVARFSNIKECSQTEKVLRNCINSFDCTRVKASSDVSEAIYTEEFGKEYQDCKSQFVRIEFTMEVITSSCCNHCESNCLEFDC